MPWVISLSALVYVFGFATDWQRLVEATRHANLPIFIAITAIDKIVFFTGWALLQAEAIRRLVTPVSRKDVLAVRGGSELLRAVSNPLADAAFLVGVSRLTGGRLEAVVAVALIPFVTHLIVLLLQITVVLPFLPGGAGANRAVFVSALIGWSIVAGVGIALRLAPTFKIPVLNRALEWLDRVPIRELLPFIGWFILLAIFDVLVQGFASRAFGVHIDWVALAGRIPVLYIALSIPSVGNFGVREFAWAELFAEFGSRDTLFAYAFATNSIFLLLNVVIGVVFLRNALSLLSEVRRSRKSGEAVPEPLLRDAMDG